LSQEAFSDVSSRTYMSTLERDLKSPTLNKLAELCEVMEVHPLTLLTLAYAGDDLQQVDQLLAQVRQELETVAKKSTRHSVRPCWRGRSGAAGSGTAGAPSIARRG
jgi:transcriptional regulator with XRE-family HTH domain